MAATKSAKQYSHRLGSIWVTPETAAALDRRSATSGQSINEIVRTAIAAHLRNAERVERKRAAA
jgi:Ribbon-helix-helix protein, copG family